MDAKQKVDFAHLNGQPMTREQIQQWITRDLKQVTFFLIEVANSPIMIDALTDVLWARYQNMSVEKPDPNQTELNLVQDEAATK